MTQSIIWDWNGTLLNDLDFCISIINKLLQKRNLTLLNQSSYRNIFSFPVKDYYAAIGFDFSKEDFSIPAQEFIDLYDAGVKNCVLHNSAIEVLTHFRNRGKRQFVVSAMKQNMLEQTLKQNNIFNFFEGIVGLDNHYAVSKIESGVQLLSKFNIEKENATIIGDTIHDFEVAENLGIKCILIADGHQSENRLRQTGANIIPSLKKITEINF